MKAELVLGNLKREREALDNKLTRLSESLAKDWQDSDQEYLCTQQYNAMCLYAHILDERIVDIEYKLEQKKAKIQELKHETCHDGKSIFNGEIDLNSCKEYKNQSPEEDECNCDEVCSKIKQMLEDIFGDEVIVYREV